jgi:hypothetical protein
MKLMKPARLAARFGAAALAVATFGSVLAVNAPPAAALTATHFGIFVGGVDVGTRLFVAGSTHDLTIKALDGSNNVDTLYTGVVTISVTPADPGSTIPTSYNFTPLDAGQHTFTGITLKKLGLDVAIGATDNTINSVMSPNGVNVAPKFTVSGITTPTAVNVPRSATVAATLNDGSALPAPAYTGTVAFSSTDAGAVLPANYTFTAGDNNTKTFANGITFKHAGTQSVTVTEPATSSAGTQSSIDVLPILGFGTSIGSPVVVGVPQTGTLTALNGDASTYNGYRGTVHFTSSDTNPSVALPSDYTFTAGDNGAHTFTNGFTLGTPGSQTVTATDTVNAVTTGVTQPAITVLPKLSVTVSPLAIMAGNPATATVTAQKGDNTTFTGYTGTVHFTSSDASAVKPADYTFVAGDSGTHTFTNGVTYKTVGVQTLIATDTVQSLITGGQGSIGVSAGILVSGITSPLDLGQASNVVVKAVDGDGVPIDGFSGTVTFSSSDSNATLPANYTFVPGTDHGQHTFTNGVSFATAGPQSVTVTDVASAVSQGSQTAITVIPHLAVSGVPNPSFKGLGETVTITAKNGDGSTATGYVGTVHVTTSDVNDTAPADYTFVAGDQGVKTLSGLSFAALGAHTVSAKDVLSNASLGTQSGINVVDAIVTINTGSTDVAGTAHAVDVTVNDGAGHNVPDGSVVDLVIVSEDPDQESPVSGTTTNGQASITFTSFAAGLSTVVAHVGAAQSSPATVTWNPGPAALVAFIDDGVADPPVNTVRTLTVAVLDENFNFVADGTTVSFATTGPAGEPNHTGSADTVDGFAQFAFTSAKVGTSTVIASVNSVVDSVDVKWVAGYWVFTSAGGVSNFGDAKFLGSMAGRPLNGRIVSAAKTPTGLGYWLVGSDGGIFTFGDAKFFGSMGNRRLNAPVIGMASTPSGNGYWLVAADGGIFSFGDAQFFGSEGARALNSPVFAMAPTPTGKGYWLIARDGGIFTHGDAQFFGSEGDKRLNKPIVGAASTPTGKGYWLVASDGGVFTHGDAGFFGSEGNLRLNSPVVGMAPSPSAKGYWLVGGDGGIFNHGDAPFLGKGPSGAVAIVSNH